MIWYSTVVFWLGMFDASAIMFGGLVAAFIVLMGWDAQKLWERIFPALCILIGSNIAAALTLGATKWLMG